MRRFTLRAARRGEVAGAVDHRQLRPSAKKAKGSPMDSTPKQPSSLPWRYSVGRGSPMRWLPARGQIGIVEIAVVEGPVVGDRRSHVLGVPMDSLTRATNQLASKPGDQSDQSRSMKT